MSGKLPPRKIDPRSRSGFGLELALELRLGAILFGGNFPRTIRVRLKKYIVYLGFELILWYIGLELNIWTWIKSLDSDWFCYNQAGMLLEMSENLLEFSVKQLVIQSRLASPIFRGQFMFGVNVVCSKVRSFRIQKALIKPKANLVPFKR